MKRLQIGSIRIKDERNAQLAFSSISPVQTSQGQSQLPGTSKRVFSHSVTFRACYVTEPEAEEKVAPLMMTMMSNS